MLAGIAIIFLLFIVVVQAYLNYEAAIKCVQLTQSSETLLRWWSEEKVEHQKTLRLLDEINRTANDALIRKQ